MPPAERLHFVLFTDQLESRRVPSFYRLKTFGQNWITSNCTKAGERPLGCQSYEDKFTQICFVGLCLLMCRLYRTPAFANAVSELLHSEHETLYCYISVRQPSADNSSSLGSKLISSNASTYVTFTSENYWGVNLLTYLLFPQVHLFSSNSFSLTAFSVDTQMSCAVVAARKTKSAKHSRLL